MLPGTQQAYRPGAAKYGGFQKPSLRVLPTFPQNVYNYGARRSAGLRVAAKVGLRLIPFLGTAFTIYEFYEIIQKLSNKPVGGTYWYHDPSAELNCTNGGQGASWSGPSPHVCGDNAIEDESNLGRWQWNNATQKWWIGKADWHEWSFDPTKIEAGELVEIQTSTNTISNEPRAPYKHYPYLDPYSDPGPAPYPWGDPVLRARPQREPSPAPPGAPEAPRPTPERVPQKRPRPRFPNPSVDPDIYPPGFRPAPRHLPRWRRSKPNPRPRQPNPLRETEQPGIAKPGRVPLHRPTVIFKPFSPTRISKKPHLKRPPAKKTKEVKVKGVIGAGSFLAAALNTVTEGLDALYCFYDGIPKIYRTARSGSGLDIRRPPPGEAGARILRAFKGETGEDLVQMLGNISNCLIMNHIEDAIIGGLAGAAGKKAGAAFHEFLPGSSRARAPLLGFTNLGG